MEVNPSKVKLIVNEIPEEKKHHEKKIKKNKKD